MKNKIKIRLIIGLILCLVASYFVIKGNSGKPSINKNNETEATQKGNAANKTGSGSPSKGNDNVPAGKDGSPAVEEDNKNKDISLVDTKYNTSGNTNSNLTNLGLVAEQGNWIYFSTTNNNQSALYRSLYDGETAPKKLADASMTRFINVVGEWVYYYNGSGSKGIYKVKTDGSQKTEIASKEVNYMKVIDGWIYYIWFISQRNEYRLHRVRTDGSEDVELSGDNPYGASISDNNIYYFDYVLSEDRPKSTLYRIDLDGRNKVKLGEYNLVVAADTVCTSNNYIYFMAFGVDGVNRLFRANLDGSRLMTLSRDIGSFNIANNLIYYFSYADPSNVYTMNLDGSNIKKLTNNPTRNPNDFSSQLDGNTATILSLIKISISRNYIFCTCRTNLTSTLIRMKLDGSGLKFLD